MTSSRRPVFATLAVVGAAAISLALAGSRAVVLLVAAPLVEAVPLRPVDAIVVLGAGAHTDGTLTADSAYRLLYGLQLFKAGVAPRVILSGGGHRHSGLTDADAMARAATLLGIPAASLILDPAASTTAAQARSVADLARQRGIASIALVTSPLHSHRAALAFRLAGLKVISVPGISSAGEVSPALLVAQDHFFARLGTTVHAVYEHVALTTYRWKGLI